MPNDAAHEVGFVPEQEPLEAASGTRTGQAGEAFTRESPILTEPLLDLFSEAALASVLDVVELGAAARWAPAPYRLPEERGGLRPAPPIVVSSDGPAGPREVALAHVCTSSAWPLPPSESGA